MISYASWELEWRKKRVEAKAKKRADAKGESSSRKRKLGQDDNIKNEVDQATSTFWSNPPLQQAVQADLKVLGNLFVNRISQRPPSDFFAGVRKGIAFDCFKEIAKDKKLAQLHQFLPYKCDSAAYSQILYAACLDSINIESEQPDSSQGEESVFLWNAFYIFALYLLHETSPLQVAPPLDTTDAQALATLSVGVVNTSRPGARFVYRRNMRPNIRVDPKCYANLQQVKELAHSKEGPVALDLVHVLKLLWPHLDLVAYPGPMNLSGLAQRQQQVESAPALEGEESLLQPPQDFIAASDPSTSNPETPYSLPPSLLDKITMYTDLRDRLRVPPSNGTARQEQTRKAMESMKSIRGWEDDVFGKKTKESSESTDLKRLTTQIKRKSRTITFAFDLPNDKNPKTLDDASSQKDTLTDPGDSLKNDPLENEEKDLSFELKIPPTLSNGLQQSIQDAVMQLVKREGVSMLEPLPSNLQTIDDLSTLASRGVSEAASLATSVGTKSGVGREALQQLLQQAANDSASATTATGVGRGALEQLLKQATSGDASIGSMSGVGRGALEQLLAQASPEKEIHDENAQAFPGDSFLFAENGEAYSEESILARPPEDISDVSDEDELLSTSGISTVGRRALGDLILEATRATRTPKRAKRSPRKTSQRKVSSKKVAVKRKPRQPKKALKPTVAPAEGDETDNSDEIDSSDDDDFDDEAQDLLDNASSVTGQGKSALKDLLSKVLTS